MTSTSIALFVKNEATDIAGWIAWHFSLGINKIFIFDDHSSDGTWEIIVAARETLNIEAFRTDLKKETSFYFRQRDSYLQAASLASGNYDWIGFLDGDEYLYLSKFDSASEFFSQFPRAHAVAINWCIYGSAGRVVRPRLTTVEAFTKHSKPDLGDNKLVKSFVRPEKLGSNYRDPHRLDVPHQHYVGPDGKHVGWSGSTKSVDWADAKIMHYICRSMEHYTQRIKRRLNADLQDSLAYWNHFDRNDLVDKEPLRHMPAVRQKLAQIYDVCTTDAARALHELWYRETKASNPTVPPNSPIKSLVGLVRTFAASKPAAYRASDGGVLPGAINVWRPRSHFGSFLYIGVDGFSVTHATEEVSRCLDLKPIYCCSYGSNLNIITLYTIENNTVQTTSPMFIKDDHRYGPLMVYQKLSAGAEGRVTLRSPASRLFLSCGPIQGGPALIECNRREAKEWEQFDLVPEEVAIAPEEARDFPFAEDGALTLDRFRDWIGSSSRLPSNGDLLRAIAALEPSARERVDQLVPGLLTVFM